LKKIESIFHLARFHFLIPGFMLYLFGYLLAIISGVEYDLAKFVLGYLIFGTAHLSVSFSNDYFDKDADKNSTKTAFSGGSKVLVEHPELEGLALKLAVILLCASIITNTFFTIAYAYSFGFFIFGFSGGLLGWFYTAPPLKLAYRGLGELFATLAVGFLMPGMGYIVASGTVGPLFQAFIIPLCCYGFFFIITVELPDFESDTLNNKKNLVVKFGRNTGKLISLIASIIGTSFIVKLLYSDIIGNFIDLTPIVILSFIPLIASIYCLFLNDNNRRLLARQVMINIFSIILFLFLTDAILIFLSL